MASSKVVKQSDYSELSKLVKIVSEREAGKVKYGFE